MEIKLSNIQETIADAINANQTVCVCINGEHYDVTREKPLYKREFPGFDAELIIPNGFEDASYHNDVCPHVSRMINRVGMEVDYTIWQDYVDPNKREHEESSRFLFIIKVDEVIVFAKGTNNWEEIEALLPCFEWV